MMNSMRKETTSKHQGALFWPHIYLPNLTRERYPKLLGMYGSPGKVMKAEKQHIIKALGYHVLCRSKKTKEDCLNVQERRHHTEKHQDSPHYKTSAYHICRYTTRKGCTTKKDLTKLSLQFLRWLLFQTDEDAFLKYVKSFPHQVTEKDYGYDHETGKPVLNMKEVVELKKFIVSAKPKQYKIIPVGYLREVQQVLAPQISKKPPLTVRSKRAQATQVIGKGTQKRLQHATYRITKLEEKLAKAENLINNYIKDNKTLMDDLKKQKWQKNATEKELEEIKEDVSFCKSDLAFATKELKKCTLLRSHCNEANANLNKLQQDLKYLPERKAIIHAARTAIKRVAQAAGKRIREKDFSETAMEKLKTRIEGAQENIVQASRDVTTAQLLERFVKFYNDVFDQDYGVLIEALLARRRE
jgi:DNA repair exonuclease SbcCD ATPase subunit